MSLLANYFSMKKLLVLLAVVGLSIYVGILGGSIISSFSDISEKVPKAVGVPVGVSPTPSSWNGTIRKANIVDMEDGNFELVGENEKIIAVLQSYKIDLRFLVGMTVSLEGKKMPNANNSTIPIIQVEKVKFK